LEEHVVSLDIVEVVLCNLGKALVDSFEQRLFSALRVELENILGLLICAGKDVDQDPECFQLHEVDFLFYTAVELQNLSYKLNNLSVC
jgi:hypothetical protein